jgi:UDP-N-acetylmuramate-alanine ligase
VAHTLDDVLATLVRIARPGDVVVTLGAGSIGTVPKKLAKALEQRGASS